MPGKRKASAQDAKASLEPQRKGKKAKKQAAGDDFQRLVSDAEAKLNATQFEEAADLFAQALQLRPDHVETLDTLAELCLTLGRVEEAHRHLLASTRVAPEEAHVKYMYLAQMAENKDALGFYEKGLAILRKQHAKCRDSEEREDLAYDICSACCSIAELYLTDLCFEEDAEQQCEKWIAECRQFNPDFAEMHQTLGSLRISQHRTEDAKEALRRAVDLELTAEGDVLGERMPSVHSQAELCKLLLEVNETKYCKRLVFHLLNADDENPYLWYLLGQCYRDETCPTTAFKCFARARKFCGTAEDLQDIKADIQQCVTQLQAEAGEALKGVNEEDDLTEDEDESGSEGEEDEEEVTEKEEEEEEEGEAKGSPLPVG